MEDGLYKASFSGPLGVGNGVVVVRQNKFSGGDSVIAYVGSFGQSGDKISAELQTFRHSGGGFNVLGQDSVNVSLLGSIAANNTVILKAERIQFSVTLTRIAA
ncbi:hypothetical protein [Pelagibacterium lentulum]|uniref:T3SS negative regulator,GrlR n=1 Tax=Pelagibacterium lentulum TaxID=2029865 RepID=A0A916RKL6_9HYPH|nr:hypothetical protein [Pelagibacterium lentulum]GGA60166.1 hypothetical protein GCM10011499_33000 [Pelagibacterium lentulum]